MGALPQTGHADGNVGAKGAVLTVKGLADSGMEPMLGRVLDRLVELWIPQARSRVLLIAMSGFPKRRAELTCWVKGRLSPAESAYNALGGCIHRGRLQSAL